MNVFKHENDIQIAKIYHPNELWIVIENMKIGYQKCALGWF